MTNIDHIYLIRILSWFYVPIVIVAVVGNVLAFVVFSQNGLANRSFSVYFRFLVVSDTLALFDPLNNFAKYQYGSSLGNHSLFVCKAFHYIADSADVISAWMYIVINLDRLIKIALPQRFHWLKKKLVQCTIGTIVYLFGYGVLFVGLLNNTYEYVVYWTKNETGQVNEVVYNQTCQYHHSANVYNWCLSVFVSYMPSVIMFIMSILIVRTLFRARSRSYEKRVAFCNPTTAATTESVRKKDVKFSVTLIVINVFYILLNMPINVLYSLSFFDLNFDWDLPYVFVSILFYSNFSLVFYVNLVFNSFFRKEFLRLVDRVFACFRRVQQSLTSDTKRRDLPMSVTTVGKSMNTTTIINKEQTLTLSPILETCD